MQRCDQYTYLGFPATATGIDFAQHVRTRIAAAVNRTKFLSVYSDAWGVAHRLQVYKTYLAPMFEYGAPLVMAWAEEKRGARKPHKKAFLEALKDHDRLTEWISNGKSTPMVDMNLCGLLPLTTRFVHLHAKFSGLVEQLPEDNPLRQSLYRTTNRTGSFFHALRHSPIFTKWQSLPPVPVISLTQFLRQERRQVIQSAIQQPRQKLLRLSPLQSRLKKGIWLADWSLSPELPIKEQDLLYAYRRGKFGRGCICACGKEWKRGHESCASLDCRLKLTVAERKEKAELKTKLQIRGVFTHLDYVLWKGELRRAGYYIRRLWQRLNETFRDRKFKEQAKESEDVVMSGC